jgi:hypothetical protein
MREFAVLGIVLVAMPAAADVSRDNAFCELTPCVPSPVKRRTLTKDEPGPSGLTCKKGTDLGTNTSGQIVMCTTAKQATADGVVVAANAYSLFHPNGRIYQTHTAANFERTLADGTSVSCGPDLVAFEPDGKLRYCKLAAARAGSPKAKVGEGIAFHPTGKVASMTLGEPLAVAGLVLPAESWIAWDAKGVALGGTIKGELVAGALTIRYEFGLHPNGKLKTVTLAKDATVAGHKFPAFGKLAFRDDGTLEAAEYVSDRGFMIHGEEWHDTKYETFDRSGKVTSSRKDHYQSDVRPPKFKN